MWAVLITASFALCLDALDVSMVGVALPSIGAELGLDNASLQWIVSGYVLGYGGLLLLGGRTADLLGRKKVFLIALVVFGAASLVGGLVDSGVLLIASRIVKGLAAAFTAPAAMSIVTTSFRAGPDRNRALSIFAVFGASGYASGLILSGLLTEIGWRWTFLATVPVVAVVIVSAVLFVPKDTERQSGGFDLLGAASLTGGMLSAVYAIVSLEHGFGTDVILTAIAAVVLIGAFFAIEKRVEHPLIRLSILKNPTMIRANVALMALFGSYLSFQTMISLYLQNGLGWGAMTMAMSLAPAGVIVAVLSPFTGRLIDRYGTSPLILGSMTAMVIGYGVFLWRGGSPEPDYVADFLPSVLLFGVGFALGFSSIVSQATGEASDDDQGLASGLVNTSGQVGGALVLAVVTGLISGGSGEGFDPYRPGLIFVTAVALAGFFVVAYPMLRRGGAKPQEAPLTAVD